MMISYTTRKPPASYPEICRRKASLMSICLRRRRKSYALQVSFRLLFMVPFFPVIYSTVFMHCVHISDAFLLLSVFFSRDSFREISGLPECQNVCKRMYGNLICRVKLLSPLFEELKDCDETLCDEQLGAFEALRVALDLAMILLKFVNQGSKLYPALQRNNAADKFQQVTEKIEAALSDISYNKLEISEEVQEQIELVHAQFKRAKAQTKFADLQLDLDMAVALKEKDHDPAILKRLSEKLHLRAINDLKKESSKLHELVIASNGELADSFETVSSLLRKLKDWVLTENPEIDNAYENEKVSVKHRSPVIPDDFRCPISLELMKDPVIVSIGQTYERSCIQKWLDAGHRTCPKTQQTLLHTALTPNYVLNSLIGLWCESNGIELPKKQGSCKTTKSGTSLSDCDRIAIKDLLDKLTSNNIEQQRADAGELRLLAKRNADNRVCIAEAGAIPLLVELLSFGDPRTQEHAVTALLNLSINESNKGTIVNAGAIPDIVDVLRNGSMEDRENAATALFSLSVLDENKVSIGAAGAIPALIKLLCKGTPRGKKDAATAIFNLCIYQGNKARAVKAGIVAALIRFMKDAGGGMVDEALAIMAILAGHHEGRMAIGQAEPIPILVEVIRTGSPRNRENAAAVLWPVCTGDIVQLKLAKEHGAEEALQGLSENGTDIAKRKAGSILELLQRIEGEDSLQNS